MHAGYVGECEPDRRAGEGDRPNSGNASIAEVGQFTIQQHLNYVAAGLTNPPFPGGLVSNHSLKGRPELAYGVTS